MIGTFILIGFLVFFALAALHIWLCSWVRRDGLPGVFGKLALQASAFAFIWGLLRGYGIVLLLITLAPPLLLVEINDIPRFSSLLLAVALYTLPAIAIVGGVAFIIPQLRIWSPTLALTTGLGVGVLVAEPISSQEMCQAAMARNAGPILRNSFLFSLRNSPREFQWNLHARTTIDGQHWGWSYRTLDWYPLPETLTQNMNTPPTPLECSHKT